MYSEILAPIVRLDRLVLYLGPSLSYSHRIVGRPGAICGLPLGVAQQSLY